eukprot:s3948_g1.t1
MQPFFPMGYSTASYCNAREPSSRTDGPMDFWGDEHPFASYCGVNPRVRAISGDSPTRGFHIQIQLYRDSTGLALLPVLPAKLKKAMEQVKLILDSEKCAQLPTAEHHSYDDKFSLVERFTHLTLASQVNSLGFLGLDKEKLRQAKTWAETSQVSVRFRAEERCSFLREEHKRETREVEDPTKHVSEISMGGMNLGLTSKTVTKVTEFFWKFQVAYQLEVFRGDRMVLQSNNCHTELKTTSKVTPQPEVKEANITFLLRSLAAGWIQPLPAGHIDLGDLSTPVFKVDRVSKVTKTPRRNAEVDAAMAYVGGLGKFMSNTVRRLADGPNLPLS